ncbi:MAG: hypothetical protein U5J63_13290 [Fodinibius sp.]|nr:hypothetical protein [Fodinibius sp.]
MKQAANIKQQVKFYSDLKEDVKQASGDYIDLKMYEPGMRNLIDRYIDADRTAERYLPWMILRWLISL